VNPMVRYTLARLGLFVACAVLLLPFNQVSLLIRLAVALVVSAVLSYFLLRGLRDRVAHQLAEAAQHRAERRNSLRAALSGEDDSPVV
jgi:hypothetical protein